MEKGRKERREGGKKEGREMTFQLTNFWATGMMCDGQICLSINQ